MKKKKLSSHSESFMAKKYNELKKWAKKEGISVPFRGRTAFEVAYDTLREEGSRRPFETMKYNLKYGTRFETAKSEFEWVKQQRVANKDFAKGLKFEDVKKMSTQGFYEKFKTEIEAYRKEMKSKITESGANMYNSYQVNKMISEHFFGSD